MRTNALLALVAAIAFPSAAHALPAFPGAQGFGAKASGGRGGRVIKVTTLAASGAGSLQDALSQSGPRIVVFDVSGVIEGDVTIDHGDVTIAGQTAPGAGITIHGRLIGEYDFAVGNIIIRHLRVRPAPLTSSDSGGDQYDAIQLSRNGPAILDHISTAYGSDETVDVFSASNVTVQWSTIEVSGLEGHPEGAHNYGLINGPEGRGFSFHHNLCAHHRARCPAIANGPADVINNVVYDARNAFVHHNPAEGEFHLIGNYFRRGPNADLFPFFFDDEEPGGTSYFLADNFVDDPPQIERSVDDIWATPYAHDSFENAGGESSKITSPTDFAIADPDYVAITTQPSSEAYALVLDHAGACPRDVVLTTTVQEVEARNGDWGATDPADLMAGLTPGTPPADADGDGMADAWESAHGLDPGNGDDHSTVRPSGYTAIEEYVNELSDQCTGQTPPDGGATGGAGGTAGSSGAGGNAGSSGGGASSGGSSAGGSSGASGSAGTSAGGKGGASSAAGGAPASSSEDDGGCGCAVPRGSGPSAILLASALGALCLARRRRRAC
jgi:pectate lyase